LRTKIQTSVSEQVIPNRCQSATWFVQDIFKRCTTSREITDS
jgi:hypothetical protein